MLHFLLLLLSSCSIIYHSSPCPLLISFPNTHYFCIKEHALNTPTLFPHTHLHIPHFFYHLISLYPDTLTHVYPHMHNHLLTNCLPNTYIPTPTTSTLTCFTLFLHLYMHIYIQTHTNWYQDAHRPHAFLLTSPVLLSLTAVYYTFPPSPLPVYYHQLFK